MALNLPALERTVPLVEENRTASFVFQRWWQAFNKALETAFNSLEAALTAVAAAQSAADAAQTAAATAQVAADAAQTAAQTAQVDATGAGVVAKLSGSGVIGATITSADEGTAASITVSSHTRVYSDGTSVAVTGTNISALPYSTSYYVYYDDPTFAGGAVSYQISSDEAAAVQVNNRHLVGSVTTPASLDPDTTGNYVKPAGLGSLI